MLQTSLKFPVCMMAEASSELGGGALIHKCSKLLSILSVSLFLSLVLIRLIALPPLRPGIADRYALSQVC